MHAYILFNILFHYGLSQNIEFRYLSYSVGPCLSSLYTIACCCLVTKSCLTRLWPKDCSLPHSSVHGISQARIPDWVAISFPK